jgi:tRNA (guanosine-2'-O-)-methyltransferase
VEKVYVVDLIAPYPTTGRICEIRKAFRRLSLGCEVDLRERFDSTDDCFDHLEKKGFKSIVTHRT